MVDYFCKCPLCAGYATRIRRRRIDRFISLFKPVYRYRCQNYYCQWQGNIRKQHLHHQVSTHA